MLAAGLVAKKANEKGLKVAPFVKTSLGPGSRVVTDYLEATGLQEELDQLGFQTVGYGCTTCIGNSGPLHPVIEGAIKERATSSARPCFPATATSRRAITARFVKANFLMSPPLVVAYALAGRVDLDLTTDPLGTDADGNPVFLEDIWPSQERGYANRSSPLPSKPEVYEPSSTATSTMPTRSGARSNGFDRGDLYLGRATSTYIQSPPFFEATGKPGDSRGHHRRASARDFRRLRHHRPHLARRRDQGTTSPAGQYLIDNGVEKASRSIQLRQPAAETTGS